MLDMKIPVLVKNDNWSIHAEKLREESDELIQVINSIADPYKEPNEETAIEILAETLDVIQMCVGIIDKLIKTYPKIVGQGIIKHVEKLYSRGWKFKKWLNISED